LLISASAEMNPRETPPTEMNLTEIFERLKGKTLLLLSDGNEQHLAFVHGVRAFGDREYWASNPFAEPSEIHLFMMNDIEWINPIAAVVPTGMIDKPLTCESVEAFLIRAYDDEGYVYVELARTAKALDENSQ